MTSTRKGLFVATILTGSFLLFLVQPMIARMALPRLGGAPAVWNSAMLVYQALLLGGYAYAHALSRLPIARQASIHLVVLVLAGLTLPIALADLSPPLPGWETVWVPLLFLMTIGPVFFAVSAQAPLMQRWFAADGDAGDPYWLYAASNIGSFGGLLAYPILLEPNLTIAQQSVGWSIGYGLLVVLVIAAAAARWRSAGPAQDEDWHDAAETIGWKRVALWLALSAVPSGLMLSTTTHLTTDIVAMPLLWVIPLSLYLLSFVFAFNENSRVGEWLSRFAPVVLLFTGGTAIVSWSEGSITSALISVTMLFVVAVALHRRLFEHRPSPARLTYFYLIMSVGGVMGGIFNGLVAPLVFDWVWEHPLLVLAAAALLPNRPLFAWMDRFDIRQDLRRPILLAMILAAFALSALLGRLVVEEADLAVLGVTLLLVGLGVAALGHRWVVCLILLILMVGRGGYDVINTSLEGARDRSFFGIYTVHEDTATNRRGLRHGTTLHGVQFLAEGKTRQPTTYYDRTSGVGLALQAAPALAGDNARIGVVGLGVGTLACYRQPGQHWEFFEIDPLVVEYSTRGTFTFMDQCAPDATTHVGDARLVLEDMGADRFDILVIDAFSSDAIPIHLVTREAFAIYRTVLAKDGVLMVHISNRYMDLQPMLAALARDSGLHARLRLNEANPDETVSKSLWVALSADEQRLAVLESQRPDTEWLDIAAPAEQVWTDDFASILPYLKWENMVGD